MQVDLRRWSSGSVFCFPDRTLWVHLDHLATFFHIFLLCFWARYCKMATTTEASARTAPMMLTTMVIESVSFGEAELVGATGLMLAGVAVPKPWVVEIDMLNHP